MNYRKLVKKLFALAVLICSVSLFAKDLKKSPYANKSNWAFLETQTEGKDADVFFIAPTVYLGSEENLYWADFDEKTRKSFTGAIMMEKGIYDDKARFFSPFYHQAALSAYSAEEKKRIEIFNRAYEEIKDAFEFYLNNYNSGRPIILAGFSQGAQLSIRLLADYSRDRKFNRKLIACYAIGWRFTQEDARKFPKIKFAKEERDTGVLIAYNSESQGITESLMIPKGVKTMAINPLNWKTDSTQAESSANLGACFTNYSGEIQKEIPNLTGAYIDPNRGSLIITGIKAQDYPGILFPDGIYHIYDYMFFYRNLEKNVQDRIESFLKR